MIKCWLVLQFLNLEEILPLLIRSDLVKKPPDSNRFDCIISSLVFIKLNRSLLSNYFICNFSWIMYIRKQAHDSENSLMLVMLNWWATKLEPCNVATKSPNIPDVSANWKRKALLACSFEGINWMIILLFCTCLLTQSNLKSILLFASSTSSHLAKSHCYVIRTCIQWTDDFALFPMSASKKAEVKSLP